MSRSESDATGPKYGEVWLVDPLDDGESWPAVVISSDAVGRMPLRLIARIDAIGRKNRGVWRVELPDPIESHIKGRPVVDTMQLHSVELSRCRERIGRVPADYMTEVAAAIAILVEFEM